MAVKIFFCYAHPDEDLLMKLKSHLSPLRNQGLIDVWHDRNISAGTEWEQEIKEQLNAAQIILLLVSPDFMASNYIHNVELKRAIERHQRGEARVIPVILRYIYWQGEPLGKLQALPKDGKPVKSWTDVDEALYDVTQGLRKVVEEVMPTLLPPPLQAPHIEPSQAESRKTIDGLAQQYDLVRTQMPSSQERTDKMVSIVGQVRILTPQAGFSSSEIKTYLESNDQGKRIVGLAMAEASPSADYFEQVLQLIQTGKRIPFEQLRALLVIEKIVQGSNLDQKQKEQLRSILENTSSIKKEGTDRNNVRRRLLSAL
jgi:hypothetical protein